MEQSTTEVLSHCPVCRAGDLSLFLRVIDQSVSKESFELTYCALCGFCFTNPRPSPEAIGRYYDTTDYISHGGKGRGVQEAIYRHARRWAIKAKHGLIARYFVNGHVLDVGCGTGEFLGHLKARGYQCTGVEPSLRAREQAIRNHSLDVLPDIGSIPAREQFQIVTLWHVLEHFHDPKEELRRIHSRTCPGGLLLVAVPDRESWDAHFYRAHWAAFDAPRHLSHFRRRDVKRLLEEQGFDLLAVKGMWFDAPYVSMLSEQHLKRGPLVAFIRGLFFGMISNLVAMLGSRPTSSSLFIARKV